MHSSLSSLASRLESIESALYGTAVTSPFGAEAPSVSAKSRKFEKSALARLSAASAVLDSNLSLDAKLDFKKCDLLLNGLGSMAPVALPTPAQQEILASCSGDVTTIAAQLQAIQELSEVALNSKVIAGVPSLLSRLAAAEAKNAYLRNATEQLQVQIESLIRAQEEVRALVSAKLYRWSLALEGR